MPKLPIGDIGAVEVVYDYGTESGQANLVISPYLGAVKQRINDAFADVQEEDFGDASVDAVFKGTTVEIEIPMARSTLLQLAGVLPGVDLSGSVLTFSNKCGSSMYDSAVPMLFKPKKDGVVSTNHAEWILVYKVFAYRAIELTFDRGTQRTHLVKFKVFPMQESGYEGKYSQEGVA